MTAVTAVGLLAAVLVVAVGLLSLRGTGDGRDLLDWDTGERRASRADARDEELALGLAEHNRRRAARGLPAQTLGELEEAARDAGGVTPAVRGRKSLVADGKVCANPARTRHRNAADAAVASAHATAARHGSGARRPR